MHTCMTNTTSTGTDPVIPWEGLIPTRTGMTG